jgi:hypothetical protein
MRANRILIDHVRKALAANVLVPAVWQNLIGNDPSRTNMEIQGLVSLSVGEIRASALGRQRRAADGPRVSLR